MHKIPPVFQELVNRVMRTFYEPKYILAMDVLNRVDWIRDEELSRKLSVPIKDIHKICGKLKEEGFIHVIQRQEAKAPGSRAIPRTYYAVDYARLINTVKWKMHHIWTKIQQLLDVENRQLGMYCPNCKKIYSTEDAIPLYRSDLRTFLCEDCNVDLRNEIKEQMEVSARQLSANLMTQAKPIFELLKETEKIKVVLTRETITTAMNKKEAAQKRAANGELAFAQDTGSNITKVSVTLVEDDRASKEELAAELEKKRQQNAMPIWFVKSTIRANQDPHRERELHRNRNRHRSELSSKRSKIETGSGSVAAVTRIDARLAEHKQRIEKRAKEEKKILGFYESYYHNLNNLVKEKEKEKEKGN